MKKSLILLLVLSSIIFSCKKDDPTTAATKTEAIKSTRWKLDKITTVDGSTVPTNKLNTSTALIFVLQISFEDNGIVKASDKVSNQIINAGTWAFTENETKVDVKVTGFTGTFNVVELSKTKLVLRNKVPISGVDTDANMEFVPNI